MSVGIASITDGDDINDLFGIIHGIDDTVVSDTDPLEVGCSLEFSTPIGSRIEREGLYSLKDAGEQRLAKALEFFPRRGAKTTL